MKKLITAADVQRMATNGEKVVHVDSNTIVTAAAVDVMKAHGMTYSNQAPCATAPCAPAVTPCAAPASKVESVDSIKEGIKDLSSNDLMTAIQTILAGQINKQEAHKPVGKFQVVNGRDVDFEEFDTGVPGNNVTYKELVGYNQSPNISSGILKIIASTFPWKVLCDEMDIVLEGCVTITIDGIAHVAKAGDVIYIPPNSEVIWSADEYAKIFYTTYPANWAEICG